MPRLDFMTAQPAAPAGTLVIGGGQAALQVVTSLRELGDTAPIVLVTDEAHLPYERPPLSKSVLLGLHDISTVTIRDDEWYAAGDVRVILDDPVVTVIRDETSGTGSATTASGQEVPFDRLALATGAAPRIPDLPGIDLRGVHYLRDIPDSLALLDSMKAGKRLVCIGGGFIGLEVAAAGAHHGLEVTVVEALDRLMARVVSPTISEYFADAHRADGIRILLNAKVAGIIGSDGVVTGVELESGEVLPADVVMVSIGAAPRSDLAEQLGLELEPRTGAILVDARALASDGRTVAIGDCAVGPSPTGSGIVHRLESVANATDQARTAAATLLGQEAAYDAVPWFWSDQGELKLQIAGLVAPGGTEVVRGDPASHSFTVLHYDDGRLVAGESVGAPKDYMVIKRALERGMNLDPEKAADPVTPLKSLLQR